MNKKGMIDEFNPIAVIMGLVGGGISLWYAGLMGMGIGGKGFIFLATTVVCYIMVTMILDK